MQNNALPFDDALTHCGLVTPHDDIDLTQHWLRQLLVAWRYQGITWTIINKASARSRGIHQRAILQKCSRCLPLIREIINFRLQTHLQEANKFMGSMMFVFTALCSNCPGAGHSHYNDVIMGAMTSQITSLTIVCSTVCSGTDQWKHKSSASPAFVRGIHRWPVNSPHKGPVTRKIFPFDDVIMNQCWLTTFVTSKLLTKKTERHTASIC